MGYSFRCKDIGQECGFEIKKAGSEEELLSMLRIHAEKSHGIRELPPSILDAVKKAIKKE